MRIQDLEELGLSANEAQVYFSLLEADGITALEISKKSKIPKSTIHDILRNLEQRGLARSTRIKNRIQFRPGDPENLAKRIELQHQTLERVLPELELFYYGKEDNRPKVRFYNTRKGIEVAAKEMADEAREVLFISSWATGHTSLPEYFPKVAQQRVEKGIKARALVTGADIDKIKEEDAAMLRETRTLTETSPLKADMWLWEKKAVLNDIQGRPNTIFIEDENMVGLLKAMFEMLWSKARD